jgi:ABC-type transport system substrate-binding protein
MWWIGLLTLLCLPLLVMAQQATRSASDLARQGGLALALAHGDKPRYGGKFFSVGNEEVPFYDMHQTSLGGIYAAVAPAYNCLIRTSPYDPKGQEIMPELADTWEVSDGGKTLTFHLHKGVKWHDGAPFSSADVKYTIERIMHPPQGMVSPRGPVFNALIERVEAPGPDTVAHANMDRDLAKSTVQQNANLIHSANPGLVVSHLTLQSEKPPFDDLRVRQAISEAVRREAISELGNQAGAAGTGVYPLGAWAMPREMRGQLIGYGPDIAQRIAHAKELLAAYEKEKGKIDWSKIKLQCATTIKFSCENAQVVQ